MKNEKAKTPARKAATEKKRPAPVGGTSGEPVAADNGKRTRPTFVPDAIFEELTGEELKDYFEPSPCLYDCACLHLAEESAFAYKHGDNDLLSRDGVADALAFIENPYNANPFKDRDGGGHYPEMLEEWREDCQDELATLAAFRYIQTDDDKLLRRLDFLRWFDTSGKPDKETMEMRAAFLERHTKRGNAIRYLMRARGDGKSDFDKQVDRFIDGLFEPRTVAPPPTEVHAEWLNARFAQAGAPLAKWLQIAVLPDYAERLADIRKQIADNYGIFPAPFIADLSYDSGCVIIQPATDIIADLLYIARDMTRRKGAGANGCAPVAADVARRKHAGHNGGISQAAFGAMLIHYGGKCHGDRYSKRTVQGWDAKPDTRPNAGGKDYTPELRNDPTAARIWAMDFNREREAKYNMEKAGIGKFQTRG